MSANRPEGSASPVGIAVSPAEVLKWRDAAGRVNEAIQFVRVMLHTGDLDGKDSGGRSADDLLFDAQEDSGLLTRELHSAAGIFSHTVDTESKGDTIGTIGGEDFGLPLQSLALLDTPDARELLALLEKAQEVAERVDASRGRALPETIPLLPGESRGTDLAESISELALRVRTEVHGAKGRE
jgi:hypothetical protein